METAGGKPIATPKVARKDLEHEQFLPASAEEEYYTNLRSLLIRDCNLHKKTIDCHQLAGIRPDYFPVHFNPVSQNFTSPSTATTKRLLRSLLTCVLSGGTGPAAYRRVSTMWLAKGYSNLAP